MHRRQKVRIGRHDHVGGDQQHDHDNHSTSRNINIHLEQHSKLTKNGGGSGGDIEDLVTTTTTSATVLDADDSKEHPYSHQNYQSMIGMPVSMIQQVRRFSLSLCYTNTRTCIMNIWGGESSKNYDISRHSRRHRHRRPPRRRTTFVWLLLGVGAILFILASPLSPLYYILWGHTTLHGGLVGRFVDCTLRSFYFRHVWKQRNRKLQTWGIQHLVDTLQLPNRAIPILPQSTLIETVIRRKHRTNVLQTLEAQASTVAPSPPTTKKTRLSAALTRPSSCGSRIPQVIFQRTSFYRPLRIQEEETPHGQNVQRQETLQQKEFDIILFDDLEMRRFIANKFDSNVLKVYDSLQNDDKSTTTKSSMGTVTNNQTFLWAICVLYWYGGYFVGPHVMELPPPSWTLDDNHNNHNPKEHSISNVWRILVDESFSSLSSLERKTGARKKKKIHNRDFASIGMAVFDTFTSTQTKAHPHTVVSLAVSMLAFPPRHDFVKCTIEQIVEKYSSAPTNDNVKDVGVFQISNFFRTEKNWKESHTFRQTRAYLNSTSKQDMEKAPKKDVWDVLYQSHGMMTKDEAVCQRQTSSTTTQGQDIRTKVKDLEEHQQNGMLVKVMETTTFPFSVSNLQVTDESNRVTDTQSRSSRQDVLIIQESSVQSKDKSSTPTVKKSPKVSIQEQLTSHNIYPTWLCMRCLKTPYLGSYDACVNAFVCPQSYQNFMFRPPPLPKNKPQEETWVDRQINVVVQTTNSVAIRHDNKRIPRIIHQTWFEELLPERYSDLVRLQNTWRSSGWDYRFYTDASARTYIEQNYPEHFLEAFDVLIPGAFKADFFRYLLLLKDGGVYADVDVLLDTNLDTFITPTMSFFVPRDLVVEYADENFCLWNGLIGSAPGHPFMVRAVERLVNLIMQRADVYDIEQDLCRRHRRRRSQSGAAGDTTLQVWKSRAVPELTLSGPCALGISINEVLGNEDALAKFYPGWLSQPKSHPYVGDALILMADKTDHGMFGFTDIDRNILVASTDLPGIHKKPQTMVEATSAAPRTDTASFDATKGTKQVKIEHYHDTTGDNVWGSEGVYRDNLVTNERIVMKQIYKQNESSLLGKL